MNALIRFAIDQRGFVLIVTGLLAVLGLIAFETLPIDAVPDITNVQVQVNTSVAGLVPEEIERTITFPIEIAIRGIPGITQVRSHTRFGLSQVTVVFEEGMDIYRARQMVSERLQIVASDLPSIARPRMSPISTGLGEVYQYTVEAEKIEEDPHQRDLQLMNLRTVQDWVVKPKLLNVKGVTEVNTIGGYIKQFQVKPIPSKMAHFGIQFSDIKDALEKTNQNIGGSYVQQDTDQFLVQAVGMFKSIEDIRTVPIKSLQTFKTVTIDDIADVDLGKELRVGAAVINGRQAVLGTTMMLLGENSRTVSLRVANAIQEIKKELPPGVKIVPLYTRYKLVNGTLGTVQHNLMMGAFLVIVVLLSLVGNVRAALITAVTIPLTLLMTFIVMKFFHVSGNLMSLGALDFGIIVDGTVIVLDNCVRILRKKAAELKRNLKPKEVSEAIYEATMEIRQAAGFGELIIVLIFVPILVLDGIAGKMFRPMAATFSIAVLFALVMSFTTVPALASFVLNGNVKDKEPRIMVFFKEWYAKLLKYCLKRKKPMLVGATASFVIGVALFMSLGGEFLPQLNEGALDIDIVRPANISLDHSIELQKKTEMILKSFPEVRHTYSRIGTAQVATDPMGVNQADTYVIFWDKSTWKKRAGAPVDQEDLVNQMIEKLQKEIPEQRIMVSQPIQMRFNELLEGTRAAVSIKIFGDDIDELNRLAKETKEAMDAVKGLGDVQTEYYGGSRVLRVEPKHDILARIGVSTNEVLETIAIAMSGEEAGFLYEGQRKFPIVIRLGEEHRSNLESLKQLPVGISHVMTSPLDKLANLKFAETPTLILRENSQRRAAVLMNPRGHDTETFVQNAQKIVNAKIKLPPGYSMEWGGDFKNLREAKKRLLVVTPIVFALVLFIIFAAFRNVFQTILVFSCVPLALVGGVLGLMIDGSPFSISAGVGFIALSGIAVLNGVVLMNYFNDLRREGYRGEELVKQGTLIRLRPVLMTALVDVFGFLPMMFSTGVGSEVQSPLASVVVGGIVSSTALTLIVLPILYLIFEKKMTVEVSS
jgi:cobalt-zinc-cadmium resistance protein CzcA